MPQSSAFLSARRRGAFRACVLAVLFGWTLSATAQQAPFSVTIERADGKALTITPPAFDAGGVTYVSLSSIARQLGVSLGVDGIRVEMDVNGQGAVLTLNDTRVVLPNGVLALRRPLLSWESEVLMAAEDVNSFLTRVFGLAIQGEALPGAPPPSAPAQEEGGLSTRNLAGDEGLALSTLETLPAPEFTPPESGGETGIHTIVIDPGHGGTDTGCIGSGGYAEKDFALATALALRDELKKSTGFRILLTRSDDRDLSGLARTNLAASERKAVLISIHAGASYSPKANGFDVYAPIFDSAPLRWSEEGGLGAEECGQLSLRLAQAVSESMAVKSATESRGARPVRLRMFRDTSTPGILVEAGFLTNASEEALLRTEGYQAKLAQGIAAGIVEVFGKASTSGEIR